MKRLKKGCAICHFGLVSLFKKKSSTRCWLKGKMGIFHLAYPWLMLWQNHDEFDGPSTVIYLATYPPNCPQKGQDGWDLSPIMRCESMLTFSFVCVTAHGSEYNCPVSTYIFLHSMVWQKLTTSSLKRWINKHIGWLAAKNNVPLDFSIPAFSLHFSTRDNRFLFWPARDLSSTHFIWW